MRALSLQGRLIAILLGLTLAVWAASVALTALYSRQIINQQIEEQLTAAISLSLHSLEAVQSDPVISEQYQKRTVPYSRTASVMRLAGYDQMVPAINLWFTESQVVVGERTPEFPRPVAEGFVTRSLIVDGEETEWRLLYRHHPRFGLWVAAGVDLKQARRVTGQVLLRSTIPLLILLPVTTAILILGVRSGLRPLRELADNIAARHSLALEPIEMSAVPAEIQPLMAALNGLLQRLRRALASEHRFTANAAHELQTPLAAIKAEVQRYLRQVSDDETRNMLRRIDARVSRATGTVTQLLTLARLDPDQEFTRQPVDLNELLVEVVAELGGLAVDRRVAIQLDAPTHPLLVAGQPDWLHILIRNLLLNALQHSPSPGAVDIALRSTAEGLSLSFGNDCEPIADSDLKRLPERFYRPAGNSAPGVGLGLSIVKRIASLHGARLRLGRGDGDRGFRATILFPAEPVSSGDISSPVAKPL